LILAAVIIIYVILLAFVYALCKAASDADDERDEYWNERDE